MLEGRDRITCQQNGEWAGGVPTCTGEGIGGVGGGGVGWGMGGG